MSGTGFRPPPASPPGGGALSPAQATDLTDGGQSAGHYHDSDRARANHTGSQLASTVSDFATAADARVTATAPGVADARIAAAAGVSIASLSGGLIPTAQLPPLAITSVSVVASQAAMLALTAEMGDAAFRTDTSRTYILSTNSPGTLADWKLVTAAGDVTSVNGGIGAVSITLASLAGGVAGQLFDNAGTPKKSLDFYNRRLYAADGTTITADWDGANLIGRWHVSGTLTYDPIALTDAATIAVDASQSEYYTLLLTAAVGATRVLGSPTGTPVDGQKLRIRIKQSSAGANALTFNAIYRFGTTIPSAVLSTAANIVDDIEFQYNSNATKWDCVGFNKGFGSAAPYTVGAIYYADTTTTLALLAAGTATYLLQSNGAGTAPTWVAPPSPGGYAQKFALFSGTGVTAGVVTTLAEVSDPDSIMTQAAGVLSITNTGTYLLEINALTNDTNGPNVVDMSAAITGTATVAKSAISNTLGDASGNQESFTSFILARITVTAAPATFNFTASAVPTNLNLNGKLTQIA